jgi:hypothetical protein
MDEVVAPLELRVDSASQRVIEAMGRTEDVKFSPNQQALAVPLFTTNQVAIFHCHVVRSDPAGPAIHITDNLVVDSPDLSAPHGLAWIDDHRMVVANRVGRVRVFEVPLVWPASRRATLKSIKTLWGLPFARIQHPGSVCTYVDRHGHLQVVVCNNYIDRVSRHSLVVGPGPGSAIRVRRDEWLLRTGLAIPDGVAISPDQEWLAVSNHRSSEVFVYRQSPGLGVRSSPDAVLDGVACPHGLCFSADGRSLLVADAGSPFVYIFQTGSTDFASDRLVRRKVRVIDDQTFLRGRGNEQEGGVKGLDVSSDGEITVTTCEQQPLAFFRTADFL